MYRFRVKNYRCFLDQQFEFSKINILIGENSSGKSSIFKFFLALKQSLDRPKESNLLLSGQATDLGTFKDMIYYNDELKKLNFSFEFLDDYYNYFDLFIDRYKYNSLTTKSESKANFYKKIESDKNVIVEFELDDNLDQHKTIKTTFYNNALGKLEIIILDNDQCKLKFTFLNNTKKEIGPFNYDKEAFFTIIYSKELISALDENEDQFFLHTAYFLAAQNYLEDFLNELQFVNPISEKPERFYPKKDKKKISWISTMSELVSFLDTLKNDDIVKDFSAILKEFGIIDEFKMEKRKDFPFLELKAKVKDHWSNITDVGYGVSLQLPVIFSAFLNNLLDSKSTILIEQPEVHLHPRLQAKMIETLVKFENNRYVIETHSEHIVRMLQYLVKEKKYNLKPSDITIHYLKRDLKKTIVSTHKILEDGRLDINFPTGFYDVSYELAKGLII